VPLNSIGASPKPLMGTAANSIINGPAAGAGAAAAVGARGSVALPVGALINIANENFGYPNRI